MNATATDRSLTIDAINHLVFKTRQLEFGIGTKRSKECQNEIVKIHNKYNTNNSLARLYREIDRLERKYQRYNFVDHLQAILHNEKV